MEKLGSNPAIPTNKGKSVCRSGRVKSRRIVDTPWKVPDDARTKILILEDNEERIKKFVDALDSGDNYIAIVAYAEYCIQYLKNADFDILFLDHDLGDKTMVPSGPGTGYEVACWLEERPDKQPPVIATHSMNPSGTEKMLQALPDAFYTPGIWSDARLSKNLEKAINSYSTYVIGKARGVHES